LELEEERIDLIERSSQRSGIDVTTVAGAVGDTVRLDDHPVPDLIKMDIEGWEYQALLSGKECLEQKRPVLLIEYHSHEAALAPDAVEKDIFYTLLHDCGYEITELDKRGKIFISSLNRSFQRLSLTSASVLWNERCGA
jgi:hypothetical protein